MPRATWKGFLRLSLVSCPVFLTPAATKTKTIRLNQVWVPRAEPPRRTTRAPEPIEIEEADEPAPQWSVRRDEPRSAPLRPAAAAALSSEARPEPSRTTRVALRPHDPETGEEIDRSEVVKGFEYERGQFVTFTPAELKTLDVESSQTIDLTTFVPRAEIDPVYFNAPYYLHPDGAVAIEPFRVIAAAMAHSGVAGIGRLTLARRERAVLIEPRGAGMVLITLRAADEVRPAEFGPANGDGDPEMIEIAELIIQRRLGHFDPAAFRDRYQDALRELIEAKTSGRKVPAKAAPEPKPTADLMAALKASLANEAGDRRARTAAPKRSEPAPAKPRNESAEKRRRVRQV